MAEVIEPTPDIQFSKKRGKYLPSEDLIIVREVAALRAHVATYGNVRQSFEKVANKINQNPHMSQKVNWKAIQDRYKRLQDNFDAEDAHNSNLSGVAGGEMGELYQALSQMREERDTFLKEKKADKTEKTKREEEKELMGRRVVEMALLRKTQRSESEEEESNGSDSNEESGSGVATSNSGNANGGSGKKKRKKRRKFERVDVGGDLAMFGANLKEAELARVKLQEEQQGLEKEKYSKEIEEREKDREERRKEREDANKLELEKFKIMFDMLKEKKQ